MLRPNDCKTFADYISSVIQPYIELHLRSATRIDLVFVRYFKDSLKSGTRSNRGSGVRRLVKPNGSMLNNWSTFLRCDENKTELFPLIVKSLAENINCVHGIFVGSVEDRAVSNQAYIDLEPLMPCNIEEADERMFVHVRNAAEDCSRILVKTVDSDVVVIALSSFHRIPSLQELWIEFGVGKHWSSCQFTRLPIPLDPKPPPLTSFSTRLVAAIPPQHSTERVRSRLVTPGRRWPVQHLYSRKWKRLREIYVKPTGTLSNNSLLPCIAKHLMVPWWMRRGDTYLQVEERPLKISLQQLLHWMNMLSDQFYKRISGTNVSKPTELKWIHWIGDGWRRVMNTYPFGVFCRTYRMWPKHSFPVDTQIVLRRSASAKRVGWSAPSYAVVGLNVKQIDLYNTGSRI